MERRTNSGRPRRSILPRCLAGAALILAGLGTMAGNHSPVQAQSAGPDPASMVNPFIGTSGSVDDFPGADAPFGMMQWSPDTPQRPAGGGYEYNDSAITGFSLDHISGPGCGAMGDVPILPWLGSIPTTPETSPGSLVQPFQHSSETAQPGYYAVTLDQPQAMPSGIRTELTVTPRSGLGRFTFPSSTQSNLLINLGGSANGTFAAGATVIGTNEVIGSIQSGHFCGAGDVYTLYFSLQFNRPFSAFGTWNGSTVTPGSHQASGGSSGVYVTFNTSSQPAVLAKVGISYVSVANALRNAATEDPGWNFDAVRQAGYHSWDNLLGKIRITGGTASEQQIFYTALYHSLLHPNIFSDVNGQYPGFDHKVHTLASGQTAQYANFSGWDIYRSQVQLLAMLDPAVGSDVAQSMVNDYSQDAMLPKWALNNGESYVMVGDPADPILAGLYAFGATHFNAGAALQDMVAEASRTNNIRPGLNYYLGMHYEPDNGQYGCCNYYGSASTTLEYTTADEAIGQFASALGNASLAQTFYRRSQNWEYLFDPSTSLIRPKELNGQFMTPFVPENFETGGYVEGDGYQYTPMVPYNLHALSTAMGGRAAYVKYLDGLFALFGGPDAPLAEPSNYAFTQSIFGGMAVPFSWQGNEPATEIPWEYDAVGAPTARRMWCAASPSTSTPPSRTVCRGTTTWARCPPGTSGPPSACTRRRPAAPTSISAVPSLPARQSPWAAATRCVSRRPPPPIPTATSSR